jgi:hypothetical protein
MNILELHLEKPMGDYLIDVYIYLLWNALSSLKNGELSPFLCIKLSVMKCTGTNLSVRGALSVINYAGPIYSFSDPTVVLGPTHSVRQ